jgi:DNA-binding beta-propeller fold protein YncE
MVSRRALLALPALAACRRRAKAFAGYAFIANQEGGALAVVDLEVMAVAKHISVQGSPTEVLAPRTRSAVYALTPDTGSIHEIDTGTLKLARKTWLGARPVTMALSADEKFGYAATADPASLVAVSLDDLRPAWRLRLPEEPFSFQLAPDGKTAAVGSAASVRLIGLDARRVGQALGEGRFGQLRFLSNSSSLIAADLDRRRLSVYSVAASRLITHLPLAVRPDYLCFNSDGGQLFVTGEGMDAVVIVYPYNTPEVAETVLAGHAPGPMAASGPGSNLLFVASPVSGEVSILSIATHRVIALAQAGADPGYIAITPDDEFALVLNRASGDVTVLRVSTIQPNRYKSAGLLTVIPVGSRPVSAGFHSV